MSSSKKIVFCGCHQGGVGAFSDLINSDYAISSVVCLTPEQAARYKISGYFDFRPLAEKNGINYYVPEEYSLSSPRDLDFFERNNFDLLIQGGWQRLFPDVVIKTLKIGALGLHGSSDRLPKGRGRSPLNWSLIKGHKRFLMHLFLISPGVDDGDIIDIKDFDINEFDDINTLYMKYDLVYRQLLQSNLPLIMSAQVSLQTQVGEPSYFPKRTSDDGLIDWENMDLYEIYNFVRAQTRPYPGAYSKVDNAFIRIWRCRPFDTRIRYDFASYGAIVEKFDNSLLINCRGGLLLVDEWQGE